MRGPQHLFLLALTLISLHPAIHVAGFSNSDNGNRRILHEPLYPLADTPPPPAEPPPVPETPNIPATDPPFVSLVPNGPGSNPTQTIAAPANVSTAVPSANSAGKIAMAISGSLAAIVLLSALVFFMYRHRIKNPTGSEKLFSGRGRRNRSENPRAPPETSTTSEFLYIGTLEPSQRRHSEPNGSSPYHKLSSNGRSELHQPSPELQPLPPLTGKPRRLSPVAMSSDEEQFYSPQGSVGGNHESPYSLVPRRHLPVFRSASTATKGVETSKSTPLPSSASAEPTFSISAIGVKHVDIPNPPPPPPPLQKTPVPCTQPKTPSPPKRRSKFSSPPSPPRNLSLPPLHDQPPRIEKISRSLPAPPPPPPPMAFRPPQPPPGKTRAPEPRVPSLPTRILARPQPLMPTPMAVKPAPVAEVNHGESSSERIDAADNRDSNKPRLKPLHWDKVRASSDRVMVWDQLKSSSFQINEDMIETLFVCNSADSVQKEAPRRPVLPAAEQGNRVLDPKKSQNIAILLRALNVTREEVCEALLDGNPDGFGAELLETMVKMAPTKEEELRLKEYRGDISKLGSAERFLKAVLDIPFAFKRVDAMLYRANFDAEVKYLRKSFESIEAACGELKNSRLFLKLLEAVLRTGNRMNVGTNRGDAQAFKLDTLLKLADVKGTDGKTTLLHFVVQEITRSEGSGLCSNKEMLASNPTQENLPNKQHPKVHEDDFKKQGLRVVAGLSTELSNVKKAAGMDSDVLSSYVSKLAMGLDKINQVLLLTNSERDNKNSNSQGKFFDLMKLFLNEAKEEIARVKAEEKKVLLLVKGITEYFHGDTAKEEAHPFRIFMIVRDFLSVLDQVCKEVGQMQERTTVYSSRSFRISASAPLPVFPRLSGNREGSSDTDSSSP